VGDVTKRVLVIPFEKADETMRFERGRADIAHFPAGTVTRWILEPGWRWSSHIGSAQGLALCPTPHLGYLVAGRMVISTPDGQTTRLSPGDAFAIPPAHDGWVEGDEPCVRIDGAATRHPQRRPRAPTTPTPGRVAG
jgi:quercetin dioxygenase-like cupin family protein